MVKYAKENRIVLKALGLCLCVILSISSGCKKKQSSEEIEQDVSAEKTTHTSTFEQIARAEASEKIDLRILYAGLLETDRAKDFVAFLAAHFKTVETTDYLTFKEKESANFDVTILDHDGVDIKAPRLWISHEYDRAAIVMGVPGAQISSRLDLKTAYL